MSSVPHRATFWLDKACLNQQALDESLLCLPLFVSACRVFLVLAGPTYTRRLWCVVEMFVFISMNARDKASERMVLKTVGHVTERELLQFRCADARCTSQMDQHKLLGAIESSFGTLKAFDADVRRHFFRMRDLEADQHHLALQKLNHAAASKSMPNVCGQHVRPLLVLPELPKQRAPRKRHKGGQRLPPIFPPRDEPAAAAIPLAEIAVAAPPLRRAATAPSKIRSGLGSLGGSARRLARLLQLATPPDSPATDVSIQGPPTAPAGSQRCSGSQRNSALSAATELGSQCNSAASLGETTGDCSFRFECSSPLYVSPATQMHMQMQGRGWAGGFRQATRDVLTEASAGTEASLGEASAWTEGSWGEAAEERRPKPGPVRDDLLLGMTLAALRADVEARRETPWVRGGAAKTSPAFGRRATAARVAGAAALGQRLARAPRSTGVHPVNGYENREAIEREAQTDGLAVCDRLHKQGTPGVGRATVFVSLWLGTPLDHRLSACERYLERNSLDPETTFFWICDYAVRQTNSQTVAEDLTMLGDIIGHIGHTLLLMEPWEDPRALSRVWCVYEVFLTHRYGAAFRVGMGLDQARRFESALLIQFELIAASMSRVDVRTCSSFLPEDREMVLSEVEKGCGAEVLNGLVIALLQEALLTEGRAALARLPPGERGTTRLIGIVGQLLQQQGRLRDAEHLFREALKAKQRHLGAKDPATLCALMHLGALLLERGKVDEATPLLEEAHRASREVLGAEHEDHLTATSNLAHLLQATGQHAAAAALLRDALDANADRLGEAHAHTIYLRNNLGAVLSQCGELDEAEAMLRAGLEASKAKNGARHLDSLIYQANLVALLFRRSPRSEEAAARLEEGREAALVTLGPYHHVTMAFARLAQQQKAARGDCAGASGADGLELLVPSRQPSDTSSAVKDGSFLRPRRDRSEGRGDGDDGMMLAITNASRGVSAPSKMKTKSGGEVPPAEVPSRV